MTAVTEFVGRYRAAGWKTVPVHRPGAEPGTCTCGDAKCAKPGKHPDPRHWPGGSADAAHFEGRNVGVLLGPDSGNLADVDLDCTEALLAAPHLLPPTGAAFGRGTAVTHHLYTVADGAAAFAQLRDPVRAGATATIVELRWPDWDTEKERPKAVQTVFPPSLHYKGKEVTWVRDGVPAAVPGAGLAAAVRRVGAAVLVARYAKPKARHDLVLLLANLGVRAGWTDDHTVVSFVAAVFAAMKDADKLEKVLRGEGPNAVGDARKRLRDGKPMTGLPALAKMLDPALGAAEAEAVVARVRDWLGLPDRDPPKPAAGAAGPKPGGAKPAAPLPPYVPFPTHLLPPAVRDYVAATAAAMNCDPAYSALPVLAALGAAIGASHAASPKKRWKEPPYVWAVAIGRSGATKSPPYRDVEDLAEDVNDRLDREYAAAQAQYDADLEAWEAAKRAGDAPGPRPAAPVRRAFLKGDVTIEALVGALKDNPRGLLIGQDELAAWIGSFVKYAGKAGTTDLPRWLQLHHAGTVNYTRKTGDPDTRVVRVRGVGLSVTGTIQPGVLARVLTDEFRASGFLARLLVARPAWRKRLWTEAEVDEPTRAALADLLAALFALPGGRWPDGRPCPHLVKLSAGAKAAFVAFFNANGAALETADEDLGAVMSKLEGYALRFALIFHCCRLREYAKDAPVTADDMAAAIELTAWFRAEAERVYQALAEPAGLRAARQLLDVVTRLADRRADRAGPPRGVTARDLQHHNTRKYPTREHAEGALEGLVAAGLGGWVDGPAPARGGHPQRLFVPRPDAADPAEDSSGDDAGGDCPTVASDTRPDGPPGGAGGVGRNPNVDHGSGGPDRPAGGSSVGSVGRRSEAAGDEEVVDPVAASAAPGEARGGGSGCGSPLPTPPAVDGPPAAGRGTGGVIGGTRTGPAGAVSDDRRGSSPTSDTSYTRPPAPGPVPPGEDRGGPTLGANPPVPDNPDGGRNSSSEMMFGDGCGPGSGARVGSVGRRASPEGGDRTRDLGGRPGGRPVASVGRTPGGYVLVARAADLGPVAAAVAAGGGPAGLDTETTGLDHARDRVRLLQLATPRGTFMVDVFAVGPAALEPVFDALATAGVVGHNLGFDLPFLMRLGFTPGRVVDTMLASQVLHAGDIAARHGLRDVADRHLGLTLQKELQQADWAGALTPDLLRYAALDAEVPLRAWPELAGELEAARLTAVAEIEFAALPCVAWAATRGVGLDRAAWQALAANADRERARLREALDAAAPDGASLFGARNWDSPDDVKAALAAVGVELEATDDDALAAVAHPVAGLVRDYRSAARLATTYGRDWLRHVAADGRVYATWKQIGAGASGRMSCKGPNLQQLPRDGRYRRCFAAPPGRALVKADYSQIELRVAAKVAKEKRMLEAYRTGEDLHTLTAKALLGKDDATKADRQLAKAVNFGLLYGQGADGLRRYARAGYGVELTEAEAVRHRETFFRTYPGLRAWHRSVGDGAVDTRTLAGRRRLGVTRYTEKLNTPIQGSGADGLKRALALLWERRGQCPDAFPVLVVHDEVVVECDADKVEEAAVWVRDALRDGMAPLVHPVPVAVEVGAGPTWGG